MTKQMNPALVSIITPTYNRKNVIGRAIESVINQSYKNYELIVIDDASTDGTTDWVSRHFPGISLISLSKNCGAAGARNQGIKISKGELIAFLDSDDQWSPYFLEEQVKNLQQNPTSVLSFCNFTLIQNNNRKKYINTEPKSVYPNLVYDLLIGHNYIETMSIVVVRRNILLQEYPLNEKLKISEDRELYLRLLYYGEFVHTPRNLVFKYLNSDNLGLDYKLLGKTAMLLLEIFFSDERSKSYRHLKAKAKSKWAAIVSGCAKLQGNHLFAFKMNLISVFFSLGSFESSKNLTKRLLQRSFGYISKLVPPPVKPGIKKIILPMKLKRLERIKTPTSLIFFVTDLCQARCKHCFYQERLNKSVEAMSLEQIRKFTASLKCPANIGLTGGEPFLRNDLLEICRIFAHYNNSPALMITTNGLSPELIPKVCEDILEQCKIKGLAIGISLDGLKETYEKIRGVKEGFAKVMETITKLLELKEKYDLLDLEINTVIMKDNYDELEELIKFTQKFKTPHKFSIIRGVYSTFCLASNICSGFNPKVEEERIVSLDKLEIIYEKICKLNDSLEYKFLSKFQKDKLKLSLEILKAKRRIIPCFAGKIDGVIYPNGDVGLCEHTKPIGNLKETSFDFYYLWNSKKADEMRRKITKCACIHGCNLCTSLTVVGS